MRKFVIGIDYGTESGRVLLADVENGKEVAAHVTQYPHGVITSALPGSERKLKRDWALQHPEDYLRVLIEGIPTVLKSSGVDPAQVIGVGVDFTSSTILPIDEKGIPLCLKDGYRDHPHSWVKLWKHHAAEAEAVQVTELAVSRKEPFLKRYGGKVSSEWMIPKILQVVHEAPEVYDRADQFVEAADWLVFRLTGNLVRNLAGAGYKGMWHDGFPDNDFFQALHPSLEGIAATKLRGEVLAPGRKVGGDPSGDSGTNRASSRHRRRRRDD